MAMGRISKSTVDSELPGARDKFLWDDKIAGFGLKVTPAGGKVYLFQYRLGGRGAKVRRYMIGKHGSITPDRARAEAKRLTMLVTQSIGPQLQKVERQHQAVELAFHGYLNRFRTTAPVALSRS